MFAEAEVTPRGCDLTNFQLKQRACTAFCSKALLPYICRISYRWEFPFRNLDKNNLQAIPKDFFNNTVKLKTL